VGTIFALQLVGIVLALAAGVLVVLWKVLHFRPRHVVAVLEVLGGVIVGMLTRDRWGEVFDTIRRNKLRTLLTAVSVGWGIFVMIVLLGMGHGLNNGARYSFRRQATSAIFFNANKTSVPYAGYGLGRRITFNNRDYDAAKKLPGVAHLSGQYYLHGGQFGGGEMKVQRGVKSNAFEIDAVHPGAYYVSSNEIVQGRYLNDTDVAGLRKVCVIGRPVRDFLFGNEDPMGQWIDIGDVAFEVVGVFSSEAGEEQERAISIPISTAQLAFNGSDHLGSLMVTVGDSTTAKQAGELADKVVGQLAASHQFSSADKQAVRVFNTVEASEGFRMLFFAISVFVVVIGCGTLLAGVVGVSNIMMISVKERTREIGIRKALGATPHSIIAMIVQEAVFLTSIAGLLGLVAGVIALEIIPRLAESELIRDPSVDIRVGVLAAAGLVVAGALAGYVPARAAARVNPVHTLRDQ